MKEQQKTQRVLELMLYLSSGIRRSLFEIARRFVSDRTAFFNIQTFRDAGFIFPKHFGILAQGNSPDLLIAPV